MEGFVEDVALEVCVGVGGVAVLLEADVLLVEVVRGHCVGLEVADLEGFLLGGLLE